MDSFTYESLLFNAGSWTIFIAGGLFIILGFVLMGMNFKYKWMSIVTWSVFFVMFGGMIGSMYGSADQTEAENNYKASVVEHVKTEGGFDKAEANGEIYLNPEMSSAITVTTGDKQDTCIMRYPETDEGQLEFLCTEDLLPLSEAKDAIAKGDIASTASLDENGEPIEDENIEQAEEVESEAEAEISEEAEEAK